MSKMSFKATELGGKRLLYNGDCQEVLKTFRDNSVDAIVTDPP